jgi:hypothetical protein
LTACEAGAWKPEKNSYFELDSIIVKIYALETCANEKPQNPAGDVCARYAFRKMPFNPWKGIFLPTKIGSKNQPFVGYASLALS